MRVIWEVWTETGLKGIASRLSTTPNQVMSMHKAGLRMGKPLLTKVLGRWALTSIDWYEWVHSMEWGQGKSKPG